MDTTTVLEIIKMVDTYKNAAYDRMDKYYKEHNEFPPYDMGAFDTMSMLSDELQSFIEGELNKAENNTPD